MSDVLYRRDHLATAIQHMPLPIRAADLAAVSAAAGWSGNRNTARKDIRSLVARGLLTRAPGAGNAAYVLRVHGRAGTYRAGCRCDACRAANTAASAARRARSAADPARADRAGHGSASTYSNHGCRCEACSAAHRARMAAAWARKKGDTE